MNGSPTFPRRIAVIGGGIAGLAAAHRLRELDPDCQVTLFEAGPRLGGVISTVQRDGFQVERSADNFITTVPWAVDLCRRLGLTDQLVQTNPAFRRTFVVRRGRLYPLPDGFLMMAPTRWWPLAVTPLLSPLGKLRAALEYFIPPREDESDESMASFVRRRLGREAYERLVEPLVGAIYAADLEKLSVLATLPRFREMEQDFGSLIRAMRHGRSANRVRKTGSESGARYSMFVTLRDGLSSLVEAIAARLPSETVHLNTTVNRIERQEGEGRRNQWSVDIQSPNLQISKSPNPSAFDALILATPSPVTAELLRPLDAELADDLARITHSGTAIVSLGYRDEQIGHPLDGMGAVAPSIEQSTILAISFSSRKYVHRSPEGTSLLRVFVGGARRPELAAMDDAELLPLVMDELSRLLNIHGEPCFQDIAHWPGTMPQYHVGHQTLVERIEARVAAIPRLALAGNAYHGVGIPDCIHGGEQAAERILKH